MASAYQDKHGWTADFRPAYGKGRKRRRVRIPAEHFTPGVDHAAAAKAYAQECERLCRLLETASPLTFDATLINRAARLGAITPDQAEAFLAQRPAAPISRAAAPAPELTLVAAFRAHPSSARTLHTEETCRHEQLLDRFVAWSKVSTCRELKLEHVMKWIRHLEDLRWRPDSIRHALVGIRRASRMAGASGLPDPISGFRLVHASTAVDIMAWSLPELCRGVLELQRQGNHRIAAVIALGGLLGLRPTEIIRAQVGDVQGDLIRVGLREAKNRDSVRTLPIPPVVRELLAPMLEGRPIDAPIIPAHTGNGKTATRATNRPITSTAFSRRTSPLLASAIGSPGTVKTLRKSFASWAIEDVPTWVVEDYLGHRHSGVTVVTSRHYLAKGRAQKLRPHAEQMDAIIRRCLREVSTNQPEPSKA